MILAAICLTNVFVSHWWRTLRWAEFDVDSEAPLPLATPQLAWMGGGSDIPQFQREVDEGWHGLTVRWRARRALSATATWHGWAIALVSGALCIYLALASTIKLALPRVYAGVMLAGLAVAFLTAFAWIDVIENKLLRQLVIEDWQNTITGLKVDYPDRGRAQAWARASVERLVSSNWHDVTPGPAIAGMAGGGLALLGGIAILVSEKKRRRPEAARSTQKTAVDPVAAEISRISVALIVVGAINAMGILLNFAMLAVALAGHQRWLSRLSGQGGIEEVVSTWLFASGICGILSLIGAFQLRRRQHYSWCVLTAVLAIAPVTLATPLGLPLGLWALVVLLRPDVKAAFGPKQSPPSPAIVPLQTTVSAVETAVRALRAAGIIVLVSAVATALFWPGLIIPSDRYDTFFGDADVWVPILLAQAASLMIGILALIGATDVRSTKRGLATVAARALLVPLTPGWLITAPLAIWVLSLLRQDDSK
jgi:hypothetical protein